MTAAELIADFFIAQGYFATKSKYVENRYWVGRDRNARIDKCMSVEVKNNIVYVWRSKRFPTDNSREGSFNLSDPKCLMAIMEWGRQRGI